MLLAAARSLKSRLHNADTLYMTDSQTPAQDSLSDQLVELTDRFTSELAAFDTLGADEVANRLSRVAFDYLVERNARVKGQDTDLSDMLPLDDEYLEAFWDSFSDTFDNAVRRHCADNPVQR
jgi:hypothetical protein